MYILEEIQKLSDEELEEYIKNRINELEENSKRINEDIDTIGYILDYNPSEFNLLEEDDDNLEVDLQCTYNGYIPKGMRMVYGLTYTKEKIAKNSGSYYYIDTDDYVYMFLKYIKDKEVNSEHDLFVYLQFFIKNYLGWIEKISRDDMFNMIYKNEKSYYDRVEEHNFSWFKNKGNAMCSEISLMAQNILAFFGFNTYIVIGYEKTKENDGECHAYNLVSFNCSETNELAEILIDFSNYTYAYDYKGERINRTPFIGILDDINEAIETLKRKIDNRTNQEEKIIIPKFKDYSYILLGNELQKLIEENKIEKVIENIKPNDELIFDDYYYAVIGDEIFESILHDKRRYSIEVTMGEDAKKLRKI